jgi:hypothetical protein
LLAGVLHDGLIGIAALKRELASRGIPVRRAPENAGAPVVTGVGDLHVENFGTWRDADARLVWGVNDFDEAAVMLRDARERGWSITGVIVRGDDAVLIGNRFDKALPIADEVADVDALPRGALAALEVAAPGAVVEQVSDPLRLAVLLGRAPDIHAIKP